MTARYDSYIICTSPRSGSTLLCKLLAATGISGNPDSHFHRPSLAAWRKSHGVGEIDGEDERSTLARVFAAAIAKGSGDTGMFGLRMQRGSADYFMEKLAVLHPGPGSDRARIEAAFGRTLFVYLSRADKVAQAVSCVKAEQTGLWHVASDGSELERLAPPRAPVYDGPALMKWYETMTGFEREWEAWFSREGIAPLRLDYDALSRSPRDTLRSVLLALGLDGKAADALSPGVKKIADRVNDEWAERLRLQIAK
ncbi:MAG: sulfotransferase [Martelella sp.]|uniref:Stf0 family sulfotransferase n=1 Tax=unclassified Martelella TaxID=2629616 RepID=UPI000C42B64D|nr:Stf0 family sulfotransferase [Martelella sp.]MAU19861.1 sulfotransferase [Martelella sp.]|tara:strand:+ start:27 stop:788 length:762 start_codon:yes stop_codon:yes gene_type:complete